MSEQETVLEIKLKRWGEARSGKVEVDSAQVLFYQARLFRAPELKLTVDRHKLLGCEISDQGEEKTVAIAYSADDGARATETVAVADSSDAEKLCRAIRWFLDQVEAERRAREGADERKKREEEEKAARLRKEYVAGVWAAADTLWSISTTVYGLVEAARLEKWNEAKEAYASIWQLGDRLRSQCGIDTIRSLEEMGQSLAGQDGEETVRKCVLFLDLISPNFVDPVPATAEWRKLDAAKEGISPNWLHLGCLLLFSLSYSESALCFETGDWAGLEHSLHNLSATSVVVARRFGIPVDEGVAGLRNAAEKRDSDGFLSNAKKLEQAVIASLAGHRPKENGPKK